MAGGITVSYEQDASGGKCLATTLSASFVPRVGDTVDLTIFRGKVVDVIVFPRTNLVVVVLQEVSI